MAVSLICLFLPHRYSSRSVSGSVTLKMNQTFSVHQEGLGMAIDENNPFLGVSVECHAMRHQESHRKSDPGPVKHRKCLVKQSPIYCTIQDFWETYRTHTHCTLRYFKVSGSLMTLRVPVCTEV